MYKNITKKLALSLSMGVFVGLGIVVTYAANLTTISSTYNTGDTLGIDWFNDLKTRLGNIYGSGGNVGIGTNSPSNKLHVTGGDILVDGVLRTSGNNGWYSNNYGGGLYMSDSSWLRTYNDKNIWTGNGYLGSNGGLTVGYGGTNPPSGGAAFAGNVGIGTNSPSYKLDVNGSGIFREGLTVFNGGGVSSLITMKDDESQNGQKHVHANSNVIGFLGGDGGWLDYFGPDGNQWSRFYGDRYSNVFRRFNTWQYSHYSGTDGAEYATIFYDANNSGYYADPNGTTRLSYLYPDMVYANNYGRVSAPALFYASYYYSTHMFSDRRLKGNISVIQNALEKIKTLKGVSYNLNEKAREIGLEEGKKDVGLIAQDVEKVFPELVSKDGNGYKIINYQHLLGPVVEAIKELADKFDLDQEKEKAQEERIKELEKEVKELKELIKK